MNISKLKDFIKTNKYPIIWTVCYIFCTWAVLYYLFNFDMFIGRNWVRLYNSELRGFAGFVFGILILAMIPIYIATTSIIIRTKKPLISIPFEKLLFWKKKEAPKPAEEEKKEESAPQPEEALDTPKKQIPSELRASFMHAKNNLGISQQSIFNKQTSNVPKLATEEELENPSKTEEESFPIPTDFDIELPEDESEQDFDFGVPNFSPVFEDTKFEEEQVEDSASPIKEFAENFGDKVKEIQEDIIITDTKAIACHFDKDFWIADEEDWFAAGKQKESPIKKLLEISKKGNLEPILYLGSENILDIEDKKKEWESQGIKVVNTAEEI